MSTQNNVATYRTMAEGKPAEGDYCPPSFARRRQINAGLETRVLQNWWKALADGQQAYPVSRLGALTAVGNPGLPMTDNRSSTSVAGAPS